MIQVDREPCAVIKHYKVRVVTYTTYDVFIIHNETTGEIEMTSFGMSVNSYKDCVNEVISIFKKQMGLLNGGLKKENLYCLVDVDNYHVSLKLRQIVDAPEKLEINWENKKWKDEEWGWRKIGEESGAGCIRFVFDFTKLEHLQKAFDVTADFHR